MYLLTSVRLTAVRLSSRADVSTIISNTSIGSSGGVGSITQVKRSEETRLPSVAVEELYAKGWHRLARPRAIHLWVLACPGLVDKIRFSSDVVVNTIFLSSYHLLVYFDTLSTETYNETLEDKYLPPVRLR